MGSMAILTYYWDTSTNTLVSALFREWGRFWTQIRLNTWCLSSRAVNGACNSLSCTMRLCPIGALATAHFLPMHTITRIQLGSSKPRSGFHVGAHWPLPHPGQNIPGGESSHGCNAKTKTTRLGKSVVRDKYACCGQGSSSDTVQRGYLHHRWTF